LEFLQIKHFSSLSKNSYTAFSATFQDKLLKNNKVTKCKAKIAAIITVSHCEMELMTLAPRSIVYTDGIMITTSGQKFKGRSYGQ